MRSLKKKIKNKMKTMKFKGGAILQGRQEGGLTREELLKELDKLSPENFAELIHYFQPKGQVASPHSLHRLVSRSEYGSQFGAPSVSPSPFRTPPRGLVNESLNGSESTESIVSNWQNGSINGNFVSPHFDLSKEHTLNNSNIERYCENVQTYINSHGDKSILKQIIESLLTVTEPNAYVKNTLAALLIEFDRHPPAREHSMDEDLNSTAKAAETAAMAAAEVAAEAEAEESAMDKTVARANELARQAEIERNKANTAETHRLKTAEAADRDIRIQDYWYTKTYRLLRTLKFDKATINKILVLVDIKPNMSVKENSDFLRNAQKDYGYRLYQGMIEAYEREKVITEIEEINKRVAFNATPIEAHLYRLDVKQLKEMLLEYKKIEKLWKNSNLPRILFVDHSRVTLSILLETLTHYIQSRSSIQLLQNKSSYKSLLTETKEELENRLYDVQKSMHSQRYEIRHLFTNIQQQLEECCEDKAKKIRGHVQENEEEEEEEGHMTRQSKRRAPVLASAPLELSGVHPPRQPVRIQVIGNGLSIAKALNFTSECLLLCPPPPKNIDIIVRFNRSLSNALRNLDEHDSFRLEEPANSNIRVFNFVTDSQAKVPTHIDTEVTNPKTRQKMINRQSFDHNKALLSVK